jgi:hypothetical protein
MLDIKTLGMTPTTLFDMGQIDHVKDVHYFEGVLAVIGLQKETRRPHIIYWVDTDKVVDRWVAVPVTTNYAARVEKGEQDWSDCLNHGSHIWLEVIDLDNSGTCVNSQLMEISELPQEYKCSK